MTESLDSSESDPWDPWEQVGVHCASYNSEIDHDLLAVFRGVIRRRYNADIAAELCLPNQYIELLQSVLCSLDWCDYGTSPRGCFPAHGKDPYELEAKLLDYIGRKWNEDGAGNQLDPPHPLYKHRS